MKKPSSSNSIGVFDSGVGGLTVLKEIRKKLPTESVVYLGDTARLPYGTKTKETIARYSLENATFLLEQQVKMLVVACNTASAFALEKLQSTFHIPVIGVIDPGAKAAAASTRNQRIAVLGTSSTIRSGVYQEKIHDLIPGGKVVAIPCPLLAPLVEERWLYHPATRLILQEYLAPLKGEGCDTVLLGCTHYPILERLIREEVGEGITLVDSASACAEEVGLILQNQELLAEETEGITRFFVSDDPEKFRSMGIDIFGEKMENVELIR